MKTKEETSEFDKRVGEAMKEIRMMGKCIGNMLSLPKILNNALFDALDAICAEANDKWRFTPGIELKPQVSLRYATDEHGTAPCWFVRPGIVLLIPDDIAGCETTWRITGDYDWVPLEEDKDNVRRLEDELDGLRLKLAPNSTGKTATLIRDTLDALERRKDGTGE